MGIHLNSFRDRVHALGAAAFYAVLLAIAGCGGSSSGTSAKARFIYVGNFADNTISQYVINQDGSLAPLAPATVAAKDVRAFATSVDGKYLYASGGSDVFQFSVGSNGTLTPLSPPSLPKISANYSRGIAVRGDNLYVADGSGQFAHLKIGVDGTLSRMGSYSNSSPETISITPDGGTLYAVDIEIDQYSVNANGSLSYQSEFDPPGVDQKFYGMAISTDGTRAYAVGNNDLGFMWQFKIASNGNLSIETLYPGPVEGYDVDIDKYGNLHASDYDDPSTIRTFRPKSAGLFQPESPAFVSPSEGAWIGLVTSQNRLYSLCYDDDVVVAYNLSKNGTKTVIGTYPCGNEPHAIAEIVK